MSHKALLTHFQSILPWPCLIHIVTMCSVLTLIAWASMASLSKQYSTLETSFNMCSFVSYSAGRNRSSFAHLALFLEISFSKSRKISLALNHQAA